MNNLSQKNNDDIKIIKILPFKYKFLLSIFFMLSCFLIYAQIQEIIKFGYNPITFKDLIALCIFIPLFVILVLFFKQRISRLTFIKINTFYCLFLAILNCYLLYIGLKKASYCNLSPSILRNGYPPCYYEIRDYEKIVFIFYHIYLIFIISTGSLILALSKENLIRTKSYLNLLLFISLFFITFIPEVIKYIIQN